MNKTLYDYENTVINEEYQIVDYLRNGGANKKAVYSDHKGSKLVRLEIQKPFDISVYNKLVEISCDNLCKVYEISESENSYIIFEEYCAGMTLAEYMESSKLEICEGITIGMQICKGLYNLHQHNIVHRDIKPDNIIILDNGDVKIIDFNIAKLYKSHKQQDTVIMGTAGFASPEQYGIAQTDRRSDIYSVGVLINYMVTGNHPSVEICNEKHLASIIRKCLCISPDDRYDNVCELYYLLEKARKGIR